MAFKSLIIFAFVASIGCVVAAPLAGGHLGARNSCQGIWCARHIAGDGNSDLSRRLAEFDGNVTLSSSTPGESTAVDPSATSVDPSPTLSLDPSPTLSVDPSSTLSVDPSATLPTDPSSVTETHTHSHHRSHDGNTLPSSTADGIPQATDPAAGGPVIITVTSTVFVNPTDPAASLPTQSPVSSSSVVSSSLAGGPSTVLLGPSSTVPTDDVSSSPVLIAPSGTFTSVSSPAPLFPSPTPTTVELTNGVLPSSVSSNVVDQSTPSPTPTPSGIIFLPGA